MAENLPARRVSYSTDVPGSPVPARPVYYSYTYGPGSDYRAGTSRGGSDYTRDEPGPSPGRFSRSMSWVDTHTPNQVRYVNVPRGVPRFLGNRNILFAAWIVAMLFASADEIKAGHAPRPARLWYVSLAYGLMLLLSEIDAFVPLVNALAIGYDIALAYEYWSGKNTPAPTGNTSSSQSGTSPASGTASQQAQTVAPGVVQGGFGNLPIGSGVPAGLTSNQLNQIGNQAGLPTITQISGIPQGVQDVVNWFKNLF